MIAAQHFGNATLPMFMIPDDLAARSDIDPLQARWLAFSRGRSLVGDGEDPLLPAAEALSAAIVTAASLRGR